MGYFHKSDSLWAMVISGASYVGMVFSDISFSWHRIVIESWPRLVSLTHWIVLPVILGFRAIVIGVIGFETVKSILWVDQSLVDIFLRFQGCYIWLLKVILICSCCDSLDFVVCIVLGVIQVESRSSIKCFKFLSLLGNHLIFYLVLN